MSRNMEPEKIASILLLEFPEFSKSADLKEGPYSILGNFAIYLRDGITDNTIRNDELDRAFYFLNEIGSSENNRETQNQFVVGVLEILADTEESVNVMKQRLKGQALELFERVLAGWNNAWDAAVPKATKKSSPNEFVYHAEQVLRRIDMYLGSGDTAFPKS